VLGEPQGRVFPHVRRYADSLRSSALELSDRCADGTYCGTYRRYLSRLEVPYETGLSSTDLASLLESLGSSPAASLSVIEWARLCLAELWAEVAKQDFVERDVDDVVDVSSVGSLGSSLVNM
jgi:hypothetical protein